MNYKIVYEKLVDVIKKEKDFVTYLSRKRKKEISYEYFEIFDKVLKKIKKDNSIHEDEFTYVFNSEEFWVLMQKYHHLVTLEVLNWLIELFPEIEGKKCKMMQFNKEDFKKWSKLIK